MFGLSIAAYHFFENPIRGSKWLETSAEKCDRSILDRSRWRLRALRMSESDQTIGIGALVLVTLALVSLAITPPANTTIPPIATGGHKYLTSEATATTNPEQTMLSESIAAAAQATSWPELNPTMDDAITSKHAAGDIETCGQVDRPDESECTWGSPSAPKSMMLLGDSIAMTYVAPLRSFAEGSAGQWKIRGEAMFGCPFVDIPPTKDSQFAKACSGHRQDAVRAVIESRPDVVVIANLYLYAGVSPSTYTDSLLRLVQQFAHFTGKVIFLSSPPADVKISDCYNRMSKPFDCVSRVTDTWRSRAQVDQSVAAAVSGIFIDSSPWFCTPDGYCPSFVRTTPTKIDEYHMTPQFAALIAPAVAEELHRQGL